MSPRIFSYIAGWREPFTASGTWFWIPLVLPHIGAVLGALIYHFMIAIHHDTPDIWNSCFLCRRRLCNLLYNMSSNSAEYQICLWLDATFRRRLKTEIHKDSLILQKKCRLKIKFYPYISSRKTWWSTNYMNCLILYLWLMNIIIYANTSYDFDYVNTFFVASLKIILMHMLLTF